MSRATEMQYAVWAEYTLSCHASGCPDWIRVRLGFRLEGEKRLRLRRPACGSAWFVPVFSAIFDATAPILLGQPGCMHVHTFQTHYNATNKKKRNASLPGLQPEEENGCNSPPPPSLPPPFAVWTL